MRFFTTHKQLVEHLKENPVDEIGIVPTMGALHEGHISLVSRAINENDLVIVTIFVNPIQFDNKRDLKNYPRNLNEDFKKLYRFKKFIIVYAPKVKDLYSNEMSSEKYIFGNVENIMEGLHRKGHFQGVATIVEKLFSIFNPQRAYFGEKDFQQLMIIRKLISQKKINITIVGCKTLRGLNGLALSSRNSRLTPRQLEHAPLIYKTLKEAKKLKSKFSPPDILTYVENVFNSYGSLSLEYFILADEKTLTPINDFCSKIRVRAFIAVKIGEIRLIDNIQF
tara:strand:- start:773 stop:1612 length:840 start_codon:yes stop_codon:yes gene_type:complete